MKEPTKDVFRDTDAGAIRLAKTLIRGADHAALAVLDPASGHPLASRISLCCDLNGAPVFLISQLSAHFAALEADPRASLLCSTPGRGDPLAHPRITVIGHAARVPDGDRASIRGRFLRYHPKAALYADFGDFAFWRLAPERASLNGGFGKAFRLEASELLTPAPEGLAALEPDAVSHMNADHPDAIQAIAGGSGWQMIGLDPEGADLALPSDPDQPMQRIWFDAPVSQTSDLRARLIQRTREARR